MTSDPKPAQWLHVGDILTETPIYKVSGPFCLKIKTDASSLIGAASAAMELLEKYSNVENDRLAQRVIIERSDVPGVSVLVCSTTVGA